MTRPTRVEINCTTGVETIIELTDEEIAEGVRAAEAWAVKQAEQAAVEAAYASAKASAQVKLAGLGLTAEEIAALTK